jgi:hypothetical protein
MYEESTFKPISNRSKLIRKLWRRNGEGLPPQSLGAMGVMVPSGNSGSGVATFAIGCSRRDVAPFSSEPNPTGRGSGPSREDRDREIASCLDVRR